jgi:hypothetical protein
LIYHVARQDVLGILSGTLLLLAVIICGRMLLVGVLGIMFAWGMFISGERSWAASFVIFATYGSWLLGPLLSWMLRTKERHGWAVGALVWPLLSACWMTAVSEGWT